MTSSSIVDKGFRKELEVTTVAARILIAKIRKHIVDDHCKCCKEALEND